MYRVPSLPPSHRTLQLRVLSSLLFCASAGLLALVLSLAVWILFSDPEKPAPQLLATALIAILALGIVGCVLCLICRVTTRITIPGLLLCSGLLVFLALDDFERTPQPNFGPVAASDSAEDRAYMRMAKGARESITAEITVPENLKDLFIVTKPEEWDAVLTTTHTRIVQEWESDTLGRAWLEELAALPANAKAINHHSITDPLIAFQPVRAIVSRRLAYALLLAHDGRSDEAVAQILKLLQACYALERIGVGPLDQMIAIVIEKKVYAATRHLLDHGPLSPTAAIELAHVLESAPGIQFIAQRTILGDLQAQRDITDRALSNAFWGQNFRQDGILRKLLPPFSCFVLHPYRMERERIQVHTKMAACVGAHQLDAAQAVRDDFVSLAHSVTSLRNPAGRKLAALATPALDKIGTNLWEQEDARQALLARLKPSPTASAIP